VAGASAVSAEAIPGPPLGATASDRAGAFCPPREGSASRGTGFAAAIAAIAIAAHRRAERA